MRVFLELFFYFIWLSFTGFLALYPRALWNKFGTHFYDRREPSEFHFDMVALLDYIFHTLKKHKVIAFTDVRNEKSIRVLERIGIRRENVTSISRPG